MVAIKIGWAFYIVIVEGVYSLWNILHFCKK